MLNTISGLLSGGAPAGGDYESIQTFTLSSSQSSVTFSSIPSTYTHLQIRSISRGDVAGTGRQVTKINFNSDTGSNYASHELYGNGSSAAASALTSSTYAYAGINPASGTLASTFGAAVVDILDYANTNKYKTTRTLDGVDYNGDGVVILTSGLWMNTAAVSSITLTHATGNFVQYSSFALYGIK